MIAIITIKRYRERELPLGASRPRPASPLSRLEKDNNLEKFLKKKKNEKKRKRKEKKKENLDKIIT